MDELVNAADEIDLLGFGDHRRLTSEFGWSIPERLSIASRVFDPWGRDRRRVALYVERADGGREVWSYWQLIRLARRQARFLRRLGVEPGDRVALVMPQGAEVAALHLAIYAVGAVALPMSRLYGPDSYRHILGDSGAKVVVVAEGDAPKIRQAAPDLDELATIVVHGKPEAGERDLADALDEPADFDPLDTGAEDPALLLYTSGSTGHPKGALHAHRIIEGYLITFRLFFDVAFDESAVFYTPSDWAWVGGLLDILLPALVLGHPVVADQQRFSAERGFEVMERYGVTHTFLAPTAVKMLAQVPEPAKRYDLALQVIASGGEAVADELLRWSDEQLGATINEFYGLTEVNHLVGGCSALWPARPGMMGLPYPGRTVAVLDPDGGETGDGEVGEIGVRPGDPTQMLGYWNNPQATEARVRNGWIMTGDLASRDPDGFIQFHGRADDMISSAGYRIGPVEVEAALIRDARVAEVAVIGSPDEQRGQVVKALVVVADGHDASPALAEELQILVKTRLAAYKYPRIVEFVDELPKTSTGKINRRQLTQRERAH